MLVGLVSLTFFFGGLILAFGFSIGAQRSWHRFTIPSVLWAGTVVLVLSSLALEAARYSLRRALINEYRRRLVLTLILGAGFLAVQCISATDLLRQGVAAEANPRGSVFYVFMAIHGVHLMAGMIWLWWLWTKSATLPDASEQDVRRHRRTVSPATMFWHFMGVLWLVMFALLHLWTSTP